MNSKDPAAYFFHLLASVATTNRVGGYDESHRRLQQIPSVATFDHRRYDQTFRTQLANTLPLHLTLDVLNITFNHHVDQSLEGNLWIPA